jgi:hypothetical protein
MDLIAQGPTKVDGSTIKLGSGQHPMPKFDDFLRDLSSFCTNVSSALSLVASVSTNPFAFAAQLLLIQKFVIFTAQGFPYESFKCSNE